ncbi:MAG: MarR family transcriptional regulator [Bacteroidia bacterium]|nr:MarR family transcriptional regulator [Bacteroidia bacterium]NNF30225.1 MarR family transcriptional regulator [Flavobacteriaceae bacterium]MBT8274514.1 MarR family transcriptional regulator [Bacteroidia bacterium]NNJ83086.1 MarR family transcriptional regulator [Flavobacteriaceae bacterium]NNK54690.1 MarR family transcriptional regulator [Flavobacteriaceae bacterium]
MDIDTAIKTIHKMAISTKTVINIMYTSRIIEEAVSTLLKPYDLTIPQYNVMRILRGQKGKPASLSTIQERMIDKSSNTTRLVDKLIRKGWVKRSVCEENRRKVDILITSSGLEILKELDPITENNNQEILKNLSEEQLLNLNNLLDTLRFI